MLVMPVDHAPPGRACFVDSFREAPPAPLIAPPAVSVAFWTRPTRAVLVQPKLRSPVARVGTVLPYSCHLVRVTSEFRMCTKAFAPFAASGQRDRDGRARGPFLRIGNRFGSYLRLTN